MSKQINDTDARVIALFLASVGQSSVLAEYVANVVRKARQTRLHSELANDIEAVNKKINEMFRKWEVLDPNFDREQCLELADQLTPLINQTLIQDEKEVEK